MKEKNLLSVSPPRFPFSYQHTHTHAYTRACTLKYWHTAKEHLNKRAYQQGHRNIVKVCYFFVLFSVECNACVKWVCSVAIGLDAKTEWFTTFWNCSISFLASLERDLEDLIGVMLTNGVLPSGRLFCLPSFERVASMGSDFCSVDKSSENTGWLFKRSAADVATSSSKSWWINQFSTHQDCVKCHTVFPCFFSVGFFCLLCDQTLFIKTISSVHSNQSQTVDWLASFQAGPLSCHFGALIFLWSPCSK